jgi:hypothetical protein
MTKKDLNAVGNLYTEQVANRMSFDNITDLINSALEQGESSIDANTVERAFNADGITDRDQMTFILVKKFNLDQKRLWDDTTGKVNLTW